MRGRHSRPETHLSPPAAPHRRKSLKLKPIRRPCSDLPRPSRYCRTGYRGRSATDTLRHSSRHTAEAASRTAESPRKPPVHPITHETPTPPKGYPAVYVPQECRANTQPGQPNTPGSRPPPAPTSPAPRRRSAPRATAARHPISSRPPCVDIALYNRYRKFAQNFSTLYCIIQIKLSIFALSNNKQSKHNKFP